MAYPRILKAVLGDSYRCYYCGRVFRLNFEINYWYVCDKCLFKVIYRVFNGLSIKKLRRLAKFFSIDILDYDNKQKLVYDVTQAYWKLLTASINKLSILSKLSNRYYDK